MKLVVNTSVGHWNTTKMIELIETYTGYPRLHDATKVDVVLMFRCNICNLIKPTHAELNDHQCGIDLADRDNDSWFDQCKWLL